MHKSRESIDEQQRQMTETITISQTLIRATSLEQFKTEQGTARMMMPYWIELGPSETLEPVQYLFKFINSQTDKDELEAQITYGVIYIQENMHDWFFIAIGVITILWYILDMYRSRKRPH